MACTLVVDPKDFSSLYVTEREYKKSARRTREWTIPALQRLGVSSGRVLSIGCANGVDVLEMRQHGYEARGKTFILHAMKPRLGAFRHRQATYLLHQNTSTRL
jgi:hypothetical protein